MGAEKIDALVEGDRDFVPRGLPRLGA